MNINEIPEQRREMEKAHVEAVWFAAPLEETRNLQFQTVFFFVFSEQRSQLDPGNLV